MQAKLEGHLQLGSDAVCGADKNRVLPALQVEAEEPSEAANFAQHIAVKRLLRQELDASLGLVAAADVNPGIGVSNMSCFGFFGHGEDFLRRNPARSMAD